MHEPSKCGGLIDLFRGTVIAARTRMTESPRDVHLLRMWLLVIAVLHWVCFFLMVHATTPRESATSPPVFSNFAQSVNSDASADPAS
jgi:hypothetical protein